LPDRPALVWFRNDLRLSDNAALRAAVHAGRPVVALYVLDDGAPPERVPGGASRWWLLHSLKALGADLADMGIELVLRRGPAEKAIADLIERTSAISLHFSRAYTPWGTVLEQRVKTRAEGLGVQCHRYRGYLLFEPQDVRTGAGEPFKVFTPFARACRHRGIGHVPQGRPAALTAHPERLATDRLEDWSLYDGRPDWARDFGSHWTPGEAGARARLHRFIETTLGHYAKGRDRPDETMTSRLSPHLHFGEISPLQVWHGIAAAMARQVGRMDADGEKFLSELLWREFSYHLLAQVPALHDAPFNARFAAIEWRDEAAALAAWQRGATGIPIVDAGMRELWQTGWMHNRVRMIAASFLVKNLLVDWRQGERWPIMPVAGNGWRGPAPMRPPISESSTRSRRVSASTPRGLMCVVSCRNWHGLRPASSTAPGRHRARCSPPPA